MIYPVTPTMDDEPFRVESIANIFWELAQQEPSYPVPIEEILGWAFPLTLHQAPQLSTTHVKRWLQENRITCSITGDDRRLRGCLFAHRNYGFIFFDSTDPLDEQRFTLAHELAHFLLDYWIPRQRALDALGERIRPVLDGLQPPTVEDRVHAVLANTPLGVVRHLMERPDEGLPTSVILNVEERADRLALEILAPAHRVLAEQLARVFSAPYPMRLQSLSAVLSTDYGLPVGLAEPYARYLLRMRGGPTIRDWLHGTTSSYS